MSKLKTKRKTANTKPVVKSFNCPNCGAALSITAVGITLSVACKSCHAILDANDPNFKILETEKKKRKSVTPTIPIGARGKLAGTTYECIGFILKNEGIYYHWIEYLLFNPYKGFRWLVESDKHWSFVKITRTLPSKNKKNNSIEYKGKKFKLFNAGQSKVAYVEGEFYWRVKVGDKVQARDYIQPPYMLSSERTESEKSWSLGYYLEPKQVEKAFGINLLTPRSVGANQPNNSKVNAKKYLKVFTQAAIVCFIILAMRFVVAKKQVVYQRRGLSLSVDQFVRTKKKINDREVYNTPSFRIAADNKNVELIVNTNVFNSWMYLDALLVNDETGKGIPVGVEVSYYRGSDWEEGSRNNSKVTYNVPRGSYHLSLKGDMGGRPSTVPTTFSIKLKSDIVLLFDFFAALVLLFLWPLRTLFNSSVIEKERWSNSDFSPLSLNG